MIKKTLIIKELNKLNILYNSSLVGTDIDLPKYYSKLALMELCGWIEENLDNLILEYSNKKLTSSSYVVNKVKNNSSFNSSSFKELLILIIGNVGFEKIEDKINLSKKTRLTSTLDNLKPMRDSHAHTTIFGTSQAFFAPSRIISDFNNVYEGIKEYEKFLKKMSYKFKK